MYVCFYICVYIYIYIYPSIYLYIYIHTYLEIYKNCTVNMGLTVSEKSVFPTSFGRGPFQGNLFSFEKHKWVQKTLFDIICLEIRHNCVTFFLTAVDEN